MFEIFGIEIMLAILQTYAKGFEPAFTFSDVTGPSGSYKEHGLLSMKHQWLEQRAADRKWVIWAEAGLATNILKQCWLEGYISMTHAPRGATAVVQTNDTHLHKTLKSEFRLSVTSQWLNSWLKTYGIPLRPRRPL